MKAPLLFLCLCLLAAPALRAQPARAVQEKIRAAALADRSAYETLGELCDRFGGRLTGSAQNLAAMEFLAARLRGLGLDARVEPFTMPGWVRGNDEAAMLTPLYRPLRIAAIGYTQPCAPFAADVVDIGQGREEDYAGRDVRGRIGLLAVSTPRATEALAAEAAARGLRGILFPDRVNGGQLLCRTGSFQGVPLPIPVFSVTQEEGFWIGRLLARGIPVRARMEARSFCREARTANLVVRLPGRAPGTVVVGAHFDSWDLGQGAIDNGLGIAQVFATAELLKKYSPQNLRTVELVWFNGEEEGLWGSRVQAARDRDEPIVAMLNLDMVGVPTGLNALGAASLVPALERYNASLGADRLKNGVISAPWLGSDHVSYLLTGVRALTLDGEIPPEVSRYYHDFGDTFDKVDPELVARSAAVVATLTYALANDPALAPERRSAAETEKFLAEHKLEETLRAQELWPAK